MVVPSPVTDGPLKTLLVRWDEGMDAACVNNEYKSYNSTTTNNTVNGPSLS